jgi:hypothetical protein
VWSVRSRQAVLLELEVRLDIDQIVGFNDATGLVGRQTPRGWGSLLSLNGWE